MIPSFPLNHFLLLCQLIPINSIINIKHAVQVHRTPLFLIDKIVFDDYILRKDV